eukprot:CAMPEP_0173405950 /NCGR_PEP_ID=MMETSP1356-20130122/63182_1 /TAXON_ID=77927 ORGANISM="Hemiselmis virescens, Strain PCC157" /NCGR_SAMPLE_ID=MMETSP1356 /ASSEMBLY_ACC=CAM_ASM_000847 /LENGTH=244 /DNA_ID=CAMNT_0014366839 /DNA_START=208 /DNA_END=942 /DNA_ORIENTATION=+
MPQISMCGMYPPEKYVFTLGMTGVAFLLASLLLVNHTRTELLLVKTGSQPLSVVYSGAQLGVGLSAALSLALMATVPVIENQFVHVLFAIAFFGLLIIFQLLNVSTRLRSSCFSPSAASRQGVSRAWTSSAKEAWMVVWMVATAAGFVLWQSTGSAVPQYVAVASAMLHFFPYIFELSDSTLRVDVRVTQEEDEEARCLRDGERVPDRHLRVRGLPVVVAAVVVAVICLGLAYTVSRLPGPKKA